MWVIHADWESASTDANQNDQRPDTAPLLRETMIEKEKEDNTRTMAKGESLQAEPTWAEEPLFLT